VKRAQKDDSSRLFRKHRDGRWYWHGKCQMNHYAGGPPFQPEPVDRLTVTVPLDGMVKGATAVVRWDLVDGRIHRNNTIEIVLPDGDDEWDSIPTQRALRYLRIGEVTHEVRQWVEGVGLPTWLEALNRPQQRRTGRRGTSVGVYLMWAQRRIEAEKQDRPIKWLAETYNETEAAVNAFLQRAKRDDLIVMQRGRAPVLTAKAKKLITEQKRKERARGAR
jgi:hypothetical protein